MSEAKKVTDHLNQEIAQVLHQNLKDFCDTPDKREYSASAFLAGISALAIGNKAFFDTDKLVRAMGVEQTTFFYWAKSQNLQEEDMCVLYIQMIENYLSKLPGTKSKSDSQAVLPVPQNVKNFRPPENIPRETKLVEIAGFQGLSVRLTNVLKNVSVETLGECLDYRLRNNSGWHASWLATPNFGRKNLNELYNFLIGIGCTHD